ncbi:MAG: hypothetical protein IKK05_03990 [Alistipes sp.]|nr:hypothetical protein [Alistipes sp.]
MADILAYNLLKGDDLVLGHLLCVIENRVQMKVERLIPFNSKNGKIDY